MQFNHYGGEAAGLAADLVNLAAPPSPAELEPLLAARDITRTRLTPAQSGALWEWSRRLGSCFGPQDLARRCAAVNELLAEASSSPRISMHDGRPPHLHYSAPDADPAAHVRAVTAAGLASVICFSGADRLGRCARCRRAYVDTSRNGRRTYCSVRCANNDAVARHRAVRRSAASPPTPR
ncbi:CGNR zinc finger domain-containing protein [Streptomyces hoynatensis]|uniref:CGNR zinc finger domain-containing protein n=1 Tax=Streptomyces hoynatensis TaxID=1141874 RepID=A0A3A9YUV3_9ACTN|nr:CGNR zinc finger domain-containing protein [Streptomyces hoynatensis]RKN39822.1 CGNR zinc finger domain-containing protein [Streptomyces hoynatensis]